MWLVFLVKLVYPQAAIKFIREYINKRNIEKFKKNSCEEIEILVYIFSIDNRNLF